LREHQDPAEVMHTQLLTYLIQKQKVNDKFNKGFKHMNLSSKEIYHVGIYNGEPEITVVNPLRFNHDESPEIDYVEDGDWATYELFWTPIQIMTKLGDKLTTKQLDKIF